MDKYKEAYEKYLLGIIPQAIADSEHTMQQIYVGVSVIKAGKRIGVVAENKDTNELFFISQEDLNRNIEGESYIETPFFNKNIRLVRSAMRYDTGIGFPYTTMLLSVDEDEL